MGDRVAAEATVTFTCLPGLISNRIGANRTPSGGVRFPAEDWLPGRGEILLECPDPVVPARDRLEAETALIIRLGATDPLVEEKDFGAR